MLPAAVRTSLEKQIGRQCGLVMMASGGQASRSYKVCFESGPTLFVKWQPDGDAALRAEKKGLETLGAADSGLVIPECVAYDFGIAGGGYLAIDWLEPSPAGTSSWTALGDGLARIHLVIVDRYGFDTDNFIGLLPQQNGWSERWPEFFASYRLQPQVAIAEDRETWKPGWRKPYERLLDKLGDILPWDPGPSLVHGDLWGGNVMVTAAGPAIFDPAVYYGHREVDLAMSQLFGGFSGSFYDAYRQAWPIDTGYEDRAEIYNLYHLLNHMNIFGGSYAGSVDRVLKRFA